jgi:hypothetical protein
MTIERMVLLVTSQISFYISSLGVSQKLIFISNQIRGGGGLHGSVIILFCFNEKIVFCILWCAVNFSFSLNFI